MYTFVARTKGPAARWAKPPQRTHSRRSAAAVNHAAVIFAGGRNRRTPYVHAPFPMPYAYGYAAFTRVSLAG